MMEQNFILATAGHVDHGKSALVKALTGTDPDRLPEEKARGITIDLGFAHLLLSAPLSFSPQPSTFSVGIIDVPGHEDFVRNMIAGVGSIDLALLVVAANEGWMPQTEEHLQIISYLGAKQLVVALTKIDLAVDGAAADQVRERLRDTEFADAQIIPTSIRTSAGLDDLKKTLAHEFATLPAPRNLGKPRLFVDRAFTLRGIGTVVTGTLMDGQFCVGDTVFVQPRKISARIRSLQNHGRDVEAAQPGMRVAMNLPDLQIGTDVQRGDVITGRTFEWASIIDVHLTRSARLRRALPIKSGSCVYIHHGTKRVLAKMILGGTNSLQAGGSAQALLKLQTPLPAFVGDRLIVRDASEKQTIAGGVILNLEDLRATQERALVASRAVASGDVALAVWTEVARGDFLVPPHVLERSRFSAAEIAAALQRLAQHGEIFLSENVAVKMLAWRELLERAANLIDAFHKNHPERRGLESSELRSELSSISPAVFEELTHDLCQKGFVRAGSIMSRSSHRPALPRQLQSAAEKIRTALSSKPFDPPSRKELTQNSDQQQALKFLIEQGEIVEISEEIVLLRDGFDQMRTAVSKFISANGPATASQLREELKTSRRVIIPFLEYLDRLGITQRDGDLRKLREPKSTAIARQ
ncbi:MAG TPA: selenocysteine-specific translation elongation factor [Chthoniobacterales bacterium]|nr:selenocysteine-specific translation elongation factor [Chthoniobacterales bacterium]